MTIRAPVLNKASPTLKIRKRLHCFWAEETREELHSQGHQAHKELSPCQKRTDTGQHEHVILKQFSSSGDFSFVEAKMLSKTHRSVVPALSKEEHSHKCGPALAAEGEPDSLPLKTATEIKLMYLTNGSCVQPDVLCKEPLIMCNHELTHLKGEGVLSWGVGQPGFHWCRNAN